MISFIFSHLPYNGPLPLQVSTYKKLLSIMLGGLLKRAQDMEELAAGESEKNLRDHVVRSDGRFSHGSTNRESGYSEVFMNNTEALSTRKKDSVKMVYGSHGIGYRGNDELRSVNKRNMHQKGRLSRAGSRSHSRIQRKPNEKVPVYHRISQNVGSSNRHGHQPRGHLNRRHAPYSQKRPAYGAPRPILSSSSPSYPVQFTVQPIYNEQKTYVPTNPSILSMVGDDQRRDYYRSPTSPEGYSPVSPAYQAPNHLSDPDRHQGHGLNKATMSELRRKLAMTILSEKLKDTVANEKHNSQLEYDPTSPTYDRTTGS